MVNLLSPPFWTPVDGNGAIYAGAKANFYRTGTTTRQDTYADFALATPNANPVEADANGAFAPIYLSADYDYKLVLTTSAGAIIKTIDPVPLQSFQTTVVLNGSELDVMPFAPPQGRLTLTSGTPVLASDVTGAATLYYALYAGNLVPLYDGTNMVPTTFAELSNILTNSATGKAGPAIAGANQNIDAFVWSDSGTVRLTRGPKWTASATVTMTIAAPGVVTWTTHGLWDGATVQFTTTGALPTGLTASTDYFVTKVDANTFKLSTTLANQVAGTFITTSGTQSGVHTGLNFTSVRGTGAGTTELQRINGIWTNKYDITNGPLANRGTYVGTIYCNASSQIDFKLGGLATGGSEAFIGLWNAYNRRAVAGDVRDSTDSWNYTTNTVRPANNSTAMRVTVVSGLAEDFLSASYTATSTNATGADVAAGIGLNSTSALSGRFPQTRSSTIKQPARGDFKSAPQIGLRYAQACEVSEAAGTTAWAGDASVPLVAQNGLNYDWTY